MIKIKYDELTEDLIGEVVEFAKYSTQLLNIANKNARGTRPNVVGQMTDLIEEFPGREFDEWVDWYKSREPDGIEMATERVYRMVQNFKEVLEIMDRNFVRRWVEDLVLRQTFIGLRVQKSVLKRIAALKREPYRRSTPAEEFRGIDGYIGDTPVSIKPATYKLKDMLVEEIDAAMIYYEKDEKKKDGIWVSYDF